MDSLKSRNTIMSKATFLLPAILLVIAISTKSFSQEGEKLFKGNCGVCHTVGKGKLVGPDLKGVNARHNETWLLKWIKSSQALIKSGDKTAVQLYNDNANLVMQDFELNDDEIKSILTFIKEKEQDIASAASEKNASVNNSIVSKNTTEHTNSSLLSMFGFSGYILIMLITLLMIVIWVMSLSIKKISIDIKEKNKS